MVLLFTDLNVYDNIAFPMRELTQLPEEMIRHLVILKLHAVGLRGVEKLMPAELSGGMARRVALARTIALDPDLILYDEPFTGLDPISLGVIAHLIHRANKALRSTSIMVTHDVGHSLQLVDQIIFWRMAKFCFLARHKKWSSRIRNGYVSLCKVCLMGRWRSVIQQRRL